MLAPTLTRPKSLILIGFTLEWILFVVSGVSLAQRKYLSAFVIFILALGMAWGVGKEIEKEAIKKYKGGRK